MLADIQLSCPFEACDEIVSYDNFKNHQENCLYNIAKCGFCNQTFPKRFMNSHQNVCNNFIRQKMADLLIDNETVKKELTATKLELSNTKLQLDAAKSIRAELRNANLEIQRLKEELRRKNESTSSSENSLVKQETGLIYECI